MSNNDLKLAKRILEGFKHYGCFIFERNEFEAVKKIARNTGIDRLVTLRKVEGRYDHIYIIIPWNIEFQQECISRVRKILFEGGINRDILKKNYIALIEQCVRFFERERIKEIIRNLENYIKSLENTGEEKVGIER
ncbi:MAG: hypothetical protein QXT88_01325 [Desulfurococcaceae archaeon]